MSQSIHRRRNIATQFTQEIETGRSQEVISEEEKLLKHLATQQRKHYVWHYCFPSITSEAERHNRLTDSV